jgi:hypothetical protein
MRRPPTPSGNQAKRGGEFTTPAVWSTFYLRLSLESPRQWRPQPSEIRVRGSSLPGSPRGGTGGWRDCSPAGSRVRGCAQRSYKEEIRCPGFRPLQDSPAHPRIVTCGIGTGLDRGVRFGEVDSPRAGSRARRCAPRSLTEEAPGRDSQPTRLPAHPRMVTSGIATGLAR